MHFDGESMMAGQHGKFVGAENIALCTLTLFPTGPVHNLRFVWGSNGGNGELEAEDD